MQPERPDDTKHLWQNQPVEENMFVSDISGRVRQYENKLRARALRAYLVCAALAAIHLYYVWKLPTPLEKIGAGIVVAGACWLAWKGRGLALTHFPAADSSALVDFYRDALSKQCKRFDQILLLVSPMLLGAAVMSTGIALAYDGGDWLRLFGPFCGLFLLWLCGLWLLHRRKMMALQREIEAVNRLASS